MGSTKKEYSYMNFNINTTTRTVQEMLSYSPLHESCSFAKNIMYGAWYKLTMNISKGMPVDCKSISQEIYDLMNKYVEYKSFSGICKDLPGDIKFFYTPTVEGGYYYNLYAVNKNEDFDFDIIQIAIGINYKCCYSNYVRTMIINPTRTIKNNYMFMMMIKRIIIYILRDGVQLSKVYEYAISIAKNQNPQLANHLKKEFGFALSPILQDDLVINSSTNAVAKYGMTFSINLNLIKLKEGKRFYDLCCVDTVLVRKNVPAEVFTHMIGTSFGNFIEIKKYNRR